MDKRTVVVVGAFLVFLISIFAFIAANPTYPVPSENLQHDHVYTCPECGWTGTTADMYKGWLLEDRPLCMCPDCRFLFGSYEI